MSVRLLYNSLYHSAVSLNMKVMIIHETVDLAIQCVLSKLENVSVSIETSIFYLFYRDSYV